MAKDIKFNGNVFSNVPRVQFLQQNDNWVGFDDTTDATATAEDITQGKTAYVNGQRVVGTAVAPTGSQTFTENGAYDVTALAEAVINVAGGGGASNVVTGEFMFDVNGVKNIDIPYMGDGYPIYLLICAKGGLVNSTDNSEWYNVIHQSGIGLWVMNKAKWSVAPSYSGSKRIANRGVCTYIYKNTSTATSLGAGGNTDVDVFRNMNPSSSSYAELVKIKNNKTVSIYVAPTNATGAGFITGVTYTYHMIYSE